MLHTTQPHGRPLSPLKFKLLKIKTLDFFCFSGHPSAGKRWKGGATRRKLRAARQPWMQRGEEVFPGSIFVNLSRYPPQKMSANKSLSRDYGMA